MASEGHTPAIGANGDRDNLFINSHADRVCHGYFVTRLHKTLQSFTFTGCGCPMAPDPNSPAVVAAQEKSGLYHLDRDYLD